VKAVLPRLVEMKESILKDIVYENEYDVITGVRSGAVKPGNVVVIRYCGPKGGPGMPEMLKPTSAIMGAGLGSSSNYRWSFSGGSHGFVVGHVTPEALTVEVLH
jgi:dihydroxy-acid dehydratase